MNMIEFFDWLDAFLTTNAGAIGAMLAMLLILAIVSAIAELSE